MEQQETQIDTLPEFRGLSLWIDDYEEIFSDFDPRPLSERTISDDFILHVRRVCKEFRGRIPTFRILVPQTIQNVDTDKIVSKRIENHFATVFERLITEMRSVRVRGLYFIMAGLLLMIVSSYIHYLNLSGFGVTLLLVLFEPGGWFLFWTGSDQLVNYSRSKKGEVDFYRKMSLAHVEFRVYR